MKFLEILKFPIKKKKIDMNSEIKSAKKYHNIMSGKIWFDSLINIYYILLKCKEKILYIENILKWYNFFMWLNNFNFFMYKNLFFLNI